MASSLLWYARDWRWIGCNQTAQLSEQINTVLLNMGCKKERHSITWHIFIYIFGMYVLLQLVQLAIKACAALSVAVQSGPADDFPSQKLDGCKPMRVSYYLDEFHDLHLSTDWIRHSESRMSNFSGWSGWHASSFTLIFQVIFLSGLS